MPVPSAKVPNLKDVIARFSAGSETALQGKPPVEKWNPPFCGEIDMRIARDGSWHYMGSPISRPAMVRLFASILRREADGSYVLVTPVEKCGIRVDDAPFVAVEMTLAGEGESRLIAFRTNVDDIVPLDAEHPLRVSINPATGEPSPYVLVRGRLEALLTRPVYYQLADLAEERELDARRSYGVFSAGQFFSLGDVL
ncbi:MAG TPA: DUF1285 domain-containing protein [Ferrovibrio sp.]|jgi:hypothetical protein|uniref:DUF1285 domain-containing protein n=1 Tax=Ferrovibrio sp. TaxID=1917215 RepID=UPI002ED5A499